MKDVVCFVRGEVADEDVCGEAVREGEERAGLKLRIEAHRAARALVGFLWAYPVWPYRPGWSTGSPAECRSSGARFGRTCAWTRPRRSRTGSEFSHRSTRAWEAGPVESRGRQGGARGEPYASRPRPGGLAETHPFATSRSRRRPEITVLTEAPRGSKRRSAPETTTGTDTMNPAEDHAPSCRDLLGLLAHTDRRAAYAALALGAASVTEVAEPAKLRPRAAAAALRKLTDGRIAAFNSEERRSGPPAPACGARSITVRGWIVAARGRRGW